MMSEYRPASRRPIAAVFRRTAEGTVRSCVRAGIHADAISLFSMVAAGAAAVCFWRAGSAPWLLAIAPGFCYLRLWCNMLDGMVAVASGKASCRGEIMNDLPDRVSDVAIFAGVAHSGLCSPFGGYWAAILAVLTAYVGVFGQAVGVQREFSGVMSKPWRMVALHVGAWAALGVWWAMGTPARWGGLTILDWTCVVVIAGCAQTIWTRLVRIARALREPQHTKP